MADQALGSDSLVGHLLGHYRLVERIGAGGMGVVYRVRDEHLDRDVAIKILPQDSLADDAARQRFRKEALALSELSHPNIATVHDFDTCDGIDYLAQELIAGRSLDEMLASGPLSEKECVDLGVQLCAGLATAHEHGIIHRDIKPGNLRVTSERTLKILDFGLAKTLRKPLQPGAETATVSETQTVVGTFPYMSPEQLRNEMLDGRTDIWAAGCVLYEMTTGRRPFTASGTGLIDQILNQPPTPPLKLNHKLSPGLEAIIQKCLEKNPALRYQSAREIAVDLRRLSGSSATVTRLPAPLKYVRGKWIAAAALVLAIAAGALYWLYRPRTPVVTGIHQLTRTGHAKISSYNIHQVATDGTRLYFNDAIDANAIVARLAQISINGGEVSYFDIPSVRNPELVGSNADGSELLVIDQFTAPIDGPIWLAALPNGPQRRIGSRAVAFGALVPGSRQLVFTQPTKLNQLWMTDLTGGNPRVVMKTLNEIFVFSLSPDGKKIRFEMAGEIWEAFLDGTALHRFLPQYAGFMCCGAWSHDGRIYSFAREEEGVNNLWAVTETEWFHRARVSTPVQLTYGPISFSTPTFSKDGKHIFALGLIQRGELAVYDKGKGEFTPYMGGLSAAYLDFSPNGQWVAYVTYPQRTLWRSRIDGSERLQLTFPPMGPVVNPSWSPDGQLIAFTEWGVVDKRIYVVPATGGAPLLLVSGSFKPTDPTWSPDGKSIAYSGVSIVEGPGTEVRILDLESRQSRTIPGSEHMFSSRWSPDGRQIAALSDDSNRLYVYSFETGRWKELTLPEKVLYPGWPSWSRDSRYVYVIGDSIYKVRVADGQAKVAADTAGIEITCPQFHSAWFGLTPDERVIVMRARGSDELYALDLEYR